MQRRRKQATLRQQLSKWKEAEELNKELVGEADARLQRPKSVDPGIYIQHIPTLLLCLLLILSCCMCVGCSLLQLPYEGDKRVTWRLPRLAQNAWNKPIKRKPNARKQLWKQRYQSQE